MAIAIQPYRAPVLDSGRTRSTFKRMAAAEERSADEARLAQRAVAGDGDAFATLYTRYEKRAYNLCLRILGSEDDAADATQEAFVNVLKRLPKLEGRELAFGSYLFTSARHACYDLIERRKRAEPSDDIAEGAVPVGGGVGGGGIGFEPGDPHEDPERNVLLAARQDEIRDANAQLPARQREVLVLRELEDLSYDEIAELMELNRNSVAQLISRARINLRDALRGTALASVAVSSADCERSLALLAARQDGQPGDGDDQWLDEHMLACDTCPLAREAMEEAGISYRAWLPVAAGPLLFRETVANAAEAVGADWSDVIARHEARLSAPQGMGARLRAAAGGGAAGGSQSGSARAALGRHRRRDLALVGVLALVLLLVGFAAGLGDGTKVEDPVPVADEGVPAETTEEPAPEPKKEKPKEKQPAKKGANPQGSPAAAPGEPQSSDDPEPVADNTPSTPSGGGGGGTQGGNQDGAAREQGGGGGDRLDGSDPPVVTDPPADPPAPDPPEPEPPVIIDPPPEEPPPSNCIPGANCPRVPGTPPSGPPTRP